MNATELFHADLSSTGIFYCAQCRLVKKTKEEADKCCDNRCQECGAKDLQKYSTHCVACSRKREREREAERFEKAEKVTEYEGWIYWEGHGWNEGYFENVEDLLDWLATEKDEDGEVEKPAYVWTCEPNKFCQLDYDHIIENATQEAYEDWDPGDVDGADELKAAIAKFNELNAGHVSYYPNYKKALLLPA